MCVMASWSIEQDVYLRVVKTKLCTAIVIHFNYYLIFFQYVMKDIFDRLRKSHVTKFVNQIKCLPYDCLT